MGFLFFFLHRQSLKTKIITLIYEKTKKKMKKKRHMQLVSRDQHVQPPQVPIKLRSGGQTENPTTTIITSLFSNRLPVFCAISVVVFVVGYEKYFILHFCVTCFNSRELPVNILSVIVFMDLARRYVLPPPPLCQLAPFHVTLLFHTKKEKEKKIVSILF